MTAAIRALAFVRRDGQVVTRACRQRQSDRDSGEWKTDPGLLSWRLWVHRLIFCGVRHGDVRAIDDEHRSAIPLPLLGSTLL